MPSDRRETACVLVRCDDRALLLDAGSGARRLVTSPGAARGCDPARRRPHALPPRSRVRPELPAGPSGPGRAVGARALALRPRERGAPGASAPASHLGVLRSASSGTCTSCATAPRQIGGFTGHGPCPAPPLGAHGGSAGRRRPGADHGHGLRRRRGRARAGRPAPAPRGLVAVGRAALGRRRCDGTGRRAHRRRRGRRAAHAHPPQSAARRSRGRPRRCARRHPQAHGSVRTVRCSRSSRAS